MDKDIKFIKIIYIANIILAGVVGSMALFAPTFSINNLFGDNINIKKPSYGISITGS